MRALCLLIALAARAATLDGTVTNAVTGAPVKKARVHARSPEGNFSAVSDASGRWSMAALPDGEYAVTVECQGYVPAAARRPAVRVPGDSVGLRVWPLGVISGKVLDEDGEPLPTVTVYAQAYDYTRPAPVLRVIAKAETDDRGEFRIFDLKPGRYYVQAAASDRAYATQFHGGASDLAQASAVDLTTGAEVSGVGFRLRRPPLFRISGKVVNTQSGEPVRAVVVAETNGSAGWRYSAQSDSAGVFSMTGVRPGTYVVAVTASSAPRPLFGEQTVVVSGRDVEALELATSPAVDIPGMVVVEGPPLVQPLNLRVTVDPAERPGFTESGTPKPDGSFTITAGPLLFALQVVNIPPQLYLRDIRFGAEDATTGRIDLRRGPAPLTLTLAPNPGRIAGTVQTADGKPAVGVLVAITPADPAMRRIDLTRTVYADSDGEFAVSSLAPGEYRVFAWEQFEPTLAGSLEFRRLLADRATAVTVRSGSEESVRLKPLADAEIQDARRRLP